MGADESTENPINKGKQDATKFARPMTESKIDEKSNTCVIKESILFRPIIAKKKLEALFNKEDSMCVIYSKNKRGMGFFLRVNEQIFPFNKCLMTSRYILDENDLRINIIDIIYQNKTKKLIINQRRKVYTDNELGYTCIEILNEDGIKQYFGIDNNIGVNQYIFSLEIIQNNKNVNELSFSSGKIISMDDNYKIWHTCSIKRDSFGIPIISKFPYNVIGIQNGNEKHNKFNMSININCIINDIINKYTNKISKQLNTQAQGVCEDMKKSENYELISKTEMRNLFHKENAMCIIYSKGGKGDSQGTGFFLYINNQYLPFKKCLMTNNHILDENDIKSGNYINISCQNEEKQIRINVKRKTYTDKNLDYTCIEILDEDNIKQFFEIDNNLNVCKDQDIFILQYAGEVMNYHFHMVK